MSGVQVLVCRGKPKAQLRSQNLGKVIYVTIFGKTLGDRLSIQMSGQVIN